MSVKKERVERILQECDKHRLRIDSAALQMQHFMPLTKTRYQTLSNDEVQVTDQFLFRFSKLQDSIGKKLFRAFLLFLDEDIQDAPFIDILNRLEKLHLLDANKWRELRDIRNDLAHDYDDEIEEMTIALNMVYEMRETLISVYQNIKGYYENYSH